jgi:hypothetical protein
VKKKGTPPKLELKFNRAVADLRAVILEAIDDPSVPRSTQRTMARFLRMIEGHMVRVVRSYEKRQHGGNGTETLR